MLFSCIMHGKMVTWDTRLTTSRTSLRLVNASSMFHYHSRPRSNIPSFGNSYITMVFMQYGGLLSVRNRQVSILQSNPLWGPRQNLVVPVGMVGTVLVAVTNLYGPGLQQVFGTTPIPGKFWGLPFCFALGVLIMDELRKLIARTYPKASTRIFPNIFVFNDLFPPL